ncbi:MAG: hypothetical protein GWP60_08600 [Gammaproteobacteria bacterium]|nr:hypothetical protein [Gammaproteobacteria bacterium]
MMICVTGLLAACADNPSAVRDAGAEQRSLRCAHDETLTCIEKMGKTQSCTCTTREDLRKIVEPERH